MQESWPWMIVMKQRIKFWTQNWKRTSTYQHTCLKVKWNPIQKITLNLENELASTIGPQEKLIMKLQGGRKIYLFCSRHPLRILYPRKHWDFKYWTQLLRRLDFEARITKALKTKLNRKQSRNVQYQKRRRAWVNFEPQL